ncbi:MAG: TetR family transcriptional regulator [Caldilineaceae bacterium]|nr:TetR family transcriptional regulator [Caldilineaceae bacterium]
MPEDDAVLETAARLLAEPGDGLTMERLAAASGLSRATLYRRFGSRRALVQRLIRERGLSAGDLLAPDVRTRVLQAARALFGREGFAAATVEQIAQEADVGPATIYRHFGSKEALVQAFIQASAPRRRLRELAATRNGDLEEDLTALAGAALQFMHDNRDLFQLALQDGATAVALRHRLQSVEGRSAHALAGYIERQMAAGRLRAGDPFELALSFLGMMFGHALLGVQFYDHPLDDPEQVARCLTRLFLHGAALSPEAAPHQPTYLEPEP